MFMIDGVGGSEPPTQGTSPLKSLSVIMKIGVLSMYRNILTFIADHRKSLNPEHLKPPKLRQASWKSHRH
jgi:hypothetical protein